MNFDDRCSPDVGNMLLSYSVQEDEKAVALGFKFLGVCSDARGEEVHVFQKESLKPEEGTA